MGLHLLFVCRYACGWLKIMLFAPIPRKRKPKPSSEYPIFRNHTYSQKKNLISKCFFRSFSVHIFYLYFNGSEAQLTRVSGRRATADCVSTKSRQSRQRRVAARFASAKGKSRDLQNRNKNVTSPLPKTSNI